MTDEERKFWRERLKEFTDDQIRILWERLPPASFSGALMGKSKEEM